MASSGSRAAVVAAFVCDIPVAIAKFVAAVITGGPAMSSHGFHSVADNGNCGLVLGGMAVSQKAASDAHPFGRSRGVVDSWSSNVAMMLFVGGAAELEIRSG